MDGRDMMAINFNVPRCNGSNIACNLQHKDVVTFKRPDSLPKYFAIDLDGTFYTDNEDAMNKNYKALKEVIKLGVTPIFCTGRTYYSSLYLFGDLKQKSGYNGYPGIYAGGSTIFGDDGRIIRSIEFSKVTLKLICEYLEEKGLISSTVFFSSTRPIICTRLTDKAEDEFKFVKCPPSEFINQNELLREKIIIIIVDSNYDLTNIEIPTLENGKDYIVIRSSHNKYEFTPPGGSKTEALKILMEHLGESPSSCGYIGDGDNDVEIMQLSNLSFAVNNADDFVKGEAKYYVKLTNDEAAVAHIFQQVYGITL